MSGTGRKIKVEKIKRQKSEFTERMVVKTVIENINRRSMPTKSDPVKKKHKIINDSKTEIEPKKVTFEKVNKTSVINLPPEKLTKKCCYLQKELNKNCQT